MELEQTPLYAEVEQIIAEPKPVHFNWQCEILVTDNGSPPNLTVVDPLKIISIDTHADYETNYADETIIKVLLSGGTYLKDIYPYKNNIDIRLYRYPVSESSDVSSTDSENKYWVYTATLIDTGNPIIESNSRNPLSKAVLDLTNIVEVEFQLVDKRIEQMRMVTVGSTYRRMSPTGVVKWLLTKYNIDPTLASSSPTPKGVTMAEDGNNNTTLREHLELPHGIKLVDAPEYIHQKCGGVYPTGFGYYYKNGYWYVYPCYDVSYERYIASKAKITIVNIPKSRLPLIDRTYRQINDNNIVIMSTGEVQFSDSTEAMQLNMGNGVRFTDASKIVDHFVDTSVPGIATATRSNLNNEFVTVNRPTQINNVTTSKNPITANAFFEYSKLAARMGCFINISWENSLPDLLIPGALIKLMYMDGSDCKSLIGVLLKAHSYVQTKGISVVQKTYTTHTALGIFIIKPSN